jgi:endonuclease G
MSDVDRELKNYAIRHFDRHLAKLGPGERRSVMQQLETGGDKRQIRGILLLSISIFVLALSGWGLFSYFSESGHTHAPFGIPDAPRIVHREAYILGYSPEHKLARWVAFQPKPGKGFTRSPKEDLDFDSDQQLSNNDYNNSGFEKASLITPRHVGGHSEEARYQTRYFTLIVPMTRALNGSAWGSVERRTEEWLKRYKSVWVITGPLYQDETHSIGGVQVPSHYFYVVYSEDKGQIVYDAYKAPNLKNLDKKASENFEIDLADLEAETGLKFFPQARD